MSLRTLKDLADKKAKRNKHDLIWSAVFTLSSTGQNMQFGTCKHCGEKCAIEAKAEQNGVVVAVASIDMAKISKKCSVTRTLTSTNSIQPTRTDPKR